MQLFQPPFISSESLWSLAYTCNNSDLLVCCYNYLTVYNIFFVDYLGVYLVCWKGYGPEHEKWIAGRDLEDNEAMDRWLETHPV